MNRQVEVDVRVGEWGGREVGSYMCRYMVARWVSSGWVHELLKSG